MRWLPLLVLLAACQPPMISARGALVARAPAPPPPAVRVDGGDRLLAEARDVMRAGVRFDTVGLGIDQDSRLMRSLAAESGGMAIKR